MKHRTERGPRSPTVILNAVKDLSFKAMGAVTIGAGLPSGDKDPSRFAQDDSCGRVPRDARTLSPGGAVSSSYCPRQRVRARNEWHAASPKAQAAGSWPGLRRRRKLACRAGSGARPPLEARPPRHGAAVDQAANLRMRQPSRPSASVSVVRVVRG